MPVHNLPAFRDNAPFPRPDRPREWVEQHDSLKRLGQSLLVDAQPFADKDEPIRAIPDPWAQARTFAEAVIDQEHSMHEIFLAQWRGLLALLALRRTCREDYTIDSKPLSLDSDHIFDRVLSRLPPRIAIGGDVGLWSKPAIVYTTPQGGKPAAVAMLNPACLISPGRLSAAIRIPHVAWAEDGLIDPLSLEGEQAVPSAYLVVLRAYLDNLRTSLASLKQSATGDTIRQRIQEYIDDTDKQLGVSPLAAKVTPGSNPDLPALYQPLWSAAELQDSDNPAATCQCRLALKSKGGQGALKGIILVDESLGQLSGRGAREVFVWGQRTLAELVKSGPMFEDVKRQAAKEGYLLVTADDLFTPRAVRLRKNPRIPGHPLVLKDMLLPLQPIALLLEGSVPNLVDADTDGERATISLKVKLEQPGGGTVSHSLVRHYRTNEGGGGKSLLVPDADWVFFNTAVWPNFRSSSWSSYFARLYYQQNAEQIRPRRALSRAIIDAALQRESGGQQAVEALERINKGKGLDGDQSWFRELEQVTEVTRDMLQVSDQGFEAIFYSDYEEDRGEADAGCVWLDIKTIETRPAETAIAAVDFGTTNTVACLRDGQPIQLKERLVNPISFDDAQTVKQQRHVFRWQFQDFFPQEARDLPTSTVAISRAGDHDADEISIFRNIIYFLPRAEQSPETIEEEGGRFKRILSQIKLNLKWSEDEAHAIAALDFLHQLVMMIAAEVAATGIAPQSIRWRFSLPDSMPEKTRRKFQQNLETVSAGFGKLEGVYSEGMAAAKYMLAGNSGANVVPGTINAVLDIGGGTTDITLWAQDEPLWRGSFRLAGQAFFTQTLLLNSEIFKTIGLGHWRGLLGLPLSPKSGGEGMISGEDIPHLAELLFSGPELPKALDAHWALKLNLKAGQPLRMAGLTFIGGIAYYLGLVAKQLVADEVIRAGQLEDPTFALCGRGAGLFARIHGGLRSDGDSDVTRALSLFSHAAEAEGVPRPRLFFEPESKLEVIRGMVADYENIDARVDARKEPSSAHLPAGLELTFNAGEALPATGTVADPIEAGKVDKVDLGGIDDFLVKLEEETEVAIDVRKADAEGAQSMIRNEVRARIDRARDDQGRIVMEEPPFITALRALILEIAKAETDPGRRVRTEMGG